LIICILIETKREGNLKESKEDYEIQGNTMEINSKELAKN